jgi:hypothetical protein
MQRLRRRLVGGVCGLLLACATGCGVFRSGTEVLTTTTVQAVSDCLEQHRNRQWADGVWDDLIAHNPGIAPSADYERGFKAGFADYLYRGGPVELPALPPWRYRWLKYRSPEGAAAVRDWFAGYRYGAAVVRDSGLRRWVTVQVGPLVDLTPPPVVKPPAPPVMAPPPAVLPMLPAPTQTEQLPEQEQFPPDPQPEREASETEDDRVRDEEPR